MGSVINNPVIRRFVLLTLITCLFLSACDVLSVPGIGPDNQALAPCTGDTSPFSSLPFNQWSSKYHTTVAQVIEAHIQSLTGTNTAKIICTAPDYASMVQPTDQLKTLAGLLAPWKDPAKLQALSETELGPVLLEYVRVYECALNERKNFLDVILPKEMNSTDTNVVYPEKATEKAIIDHESALARPALDATLAILSGQDRLRPLALDIECLKRTSLDIRNILGLISQASMCLPRVRDARGSLRDLPDLPTQ